MMVKTIRVIRLFWLWTESQWLCVQQNIINNKKNNMANFSCFLPFLGSVFWIIRYSLVFIDFYLRFCQLIGKFHKKWDEEWRLPFCAIHLPWKDCMLACITEGRKHKRMQLQWNQMFSIPWDGSRNKTHTRSESYH